MIVLEASPMWVIRAFTDGLSWQRNGLVDEARV